MFHNPLFHYYGLVFYLLNRLDFEFIECHFVSFDCLTSTGE